MYYVFEKKSEFFIKNVLNVRIFKIIPKILEMP